jgi:hypothetical protein
MPSVADKIKILLQWSPALNYLIAISSAPPGRDRVYRAIDLLDFLATKTPTGLDNELLAHCRSVLLTPAGGELLDYLATILNNVFNEVPPVRLHDPKV